MPIRTSAGSLAPARRGSGVSQERRGVLRPTRRRPPPPSAKGVTEATVELFGGQVEWYSQGGMNGVDRSRSVLDRSRPMNADDMARASRDAGKGLRSLTARLKDAEKAVEADRKQRENVVQSRSQVVSIGRGLFRTDIFGGASDSPWGAADPFAQLRADMSGGGEH